MVSLLKSWIEEIQEQYEKTGSHDQLGGTGALPQHASLASVPNVDSFFDDEDELWMLEAEKKAADEQDDTLTVPIAPVQKMDVIPPDRKIGHDCDDGDTFFSQAEVEAIIKTTEFIEQLGYGADEEPATQEGDDTRGHRDGENEKGNVMSKHGIENKLGETEPKDDVDLVIVNPQPSTSAQSCPKKGATGNITNLL